MSDIMKDFPYGIAAVNKEGSVLHFCVYPEKPTEKEFEALNLELNTNEDFHIPDDGEIYLIDATEEMMEKIRDIAKNDDDLIIEDHQADG